MASFCLASDGLLSPVCKLIVVFEDIYRHLVIALEGLLGVGPKGPHAQFFVGSGALLVGFQVEAAFMDDAEENFPLIEPVTAEHSAALNVLKVA